MSVPVIQKCCYHELPLPERCCKRCAFFIRFGSFQSCAYMNALDTLSDAYEIDSYGICNHFFSFENAKLFKDCSSPEELELKLTVAGIDIDPLLLVELKDGFGTYEKATASMIQYALLIHNTLFPMNEEIMDMPVSIDINTLYNTSFAMHIPTDTLGIQFSQNFHRVAAYIKNNKKIFRQYFANREQTSSFDVYCKTAMM